MSDFVEVNWQLKNDGAMLMGPSVVTLMVLL